MALANTILTAVSTLAVLATVWLAYLALGKARETVNEARAARLDAEQAGRDAAAERRAAAEDRHRAAVDRREAEADRRAEEYDRDRRRLERVGEIVEDLFWATQLAAQGGKVADNQWMAQRNLLRHALVGLHDRLPAAANILNCAMSSQATETSVMARNEVERELGKVAAKRSSITSSDHES